MSEVQAALEAGSQSLVLKLSKWYQTCCNGETEAWDEVGGGIGFFFRQSWLTLLTCQLLVRWTSVLLPYLRTGARRRDVSLDNG
jgi:hypothetical protein